MAEVSDEEGARGRLLLVESIRDVDYFEFEAPPSKSMFYRLAALLPANLGCVKRIPAAQDAEYTAGIILECGGVIVSDDRLCMDYFRESKVYDIDVGCSGGALRIVVPALLEMAPLNAVVRIRMCHRLRYRFDAESLEFFSRYGSVEFTEDKRGPLLIIRKEKSPDTFDVKCRVSSQIASGALIAAATRASLTDREVHLRICCKVSRGHIYQTLYTLELAGYTVHAREDGECFYVHLQPSMKRIVATVPGDWSLSGFIAVPLALRDTIVHVKGLWRPWCGPGDHELIRYLELSGLQVTMSEHGNYADITIARQGAVYFDIESSLGDTPDLTVTISVLCSIGRCKLTGLSHLVYKESNRLETITSVLRKLGLQAYHTSDSIVITGGSARRHVVIDCPDDHRIAMLAAAAGIVLDALPLYISRWQCVSKSWASFWNILGRVAVVEVL